MDRDEIQEFLAESLPRYLANAPISLSLRELNRLIGVRIVQEETGEFKGKLLDVGCGDGFWWTFLDRNGLEIFGVDIAANEIRLAGGILNHVALIDISRSMPFGDVQFDVVVGNCSLEHIPDIDSALLNMRRAARVGARLVMFVPTPLWAIQGRLQAILMKHCPRLGMAVAGLLNGFFQHWHMYNHRVWSAILKANGWHKERVYGLGGKNSEFLFRLFLPSALMAFLFKKIFGFYPNRILKFVPNFLMAPLIRMLTRSLAAPIVDADDQTAYEYMIVARAGDTSAA